MTTVHRIGGRRALFASLVALASILSMGSSCGPGDAGLNEPITVPYVVELAGPRAPDGSRELRLGAPDAEALGLGDGVISIDRGRFWLQTTIEATAGNADVVYCLESPADVVDRASGARVAAIPVGTCLGQGSLVVPTVDHPELDVEPEQYPPPESLSPPTVTLSGDLVVNIDGCTRVGGSRLAWPEGTTIDAAAAVHVRDGRVLPDGASVSLRVWEGTSGLDVNRTWCGGDTIFVVQPMA